MQMFASLLVLLAAAGPTVAKCRTGFSRYPSWNAKRFPLWKEGDPRYRDAWKGGRVTFRVGNDSPTLTGASVSFTIDLQFPHSQRLRPDGVLVWDRDGTLNGTRYRQSEEVYAAADPNWQPLFPDGTPANREQQPADQEQQPANREQQPAYVFVWKTWGRYWQVADGPSSSLTVGTDGVPLGSYNMDIVIYHYRSKDKFIPLGYASTQFSITDQIPFAVSLDQVGDPVSGDLRFQQNRAIGFSVALHDPGRFLRGADVTFNWDFGDGSGALISRELTVTHTYVSPGSFRPQVVVQAVIPDKACDPPSAAPTGAPGPPADRGTTGSPGSAAVPLDLDLVPPDPEGGHHTEDGSSSATNSQPPQETLRLEKTRPPGHQPPRGRERTHLSAAERSTGDPPGEDCTIYRYGSFCTGIEVFEAIEKVEIVQMDTPTAASGRDRKTVDITVTCQGSLPKEVCSVILDPECLRPIHTACSTVEPSGGCQLVLRHLFNNSGVYCVNVSMANDVSFAVTSTKVSVGIGPGVFSSGLVAMLLGAVLLLIVALAIVLHSSKRPLVDAAAQPGGPGGWFRGLLGRRAAVDHRPLLEDA